MKEANETPKATETEAPKAKAPTVEVQKKVRTKMTPAQKKKAKREANLRCAKKNPEKYGKRTVKTNWLLEQLDDQRKGLESDKAGASSHKKTQINAQLKVISSLREEVLNNIIG